MALHPKIKELKRRAAPINYSNVSVNERGELSDNFLSDLDNRIVSGYLLVWRSINMHGEMFIKGCCAKSINDRGPQSNANYKITFLNQHRQGEKPMTMLALAPMDTTELTDLATISRATAFDPDFGLLMRARVVQRMQQVIQVGVQVVGMN